ncbi:MAG TPA: hypothetical protein VN381_17420, partial [Anaerovoracaceae bacterium]|nr:hypothetical protein [Anaerovoracaceae bacterium]
VYAMSAMCVSETAWAEFSPEQQAAIQRAAEEVQPWQIQATRDLIDKYMIEMRANGVVITELSDEDIATFMPAAERTWENMKSIYGEDKIEQLKAEISAVRGK